MTRPKAENLKENEAKDIKFRVLNELGLNEYESRAYLTVLEAGIVVAREISDRSGIPYAKVYQVLENLIQKQLIIGDESRPKKFRSKNPSEAFFERLDSIETEWTEKHQRRVDLVTREINGFEDLFKTNKENIKEEQGVWTIVGLTNIISRIQKLVDKTNNKLRVITQDPEFIIPKLPNVKNSVTVEIKSNAKNDLLADFSDKIIQVDEVGSATIIIFDDFAHLSIIAKNKGQFSKGEYVGILTQIKEIVESSIIEFY
ncbi:MAG: TrmB family transcriptional regulator [Candidatus Kariarchaeaceae archaeon]|jgi:sugar-specific transcriptional regulator TrmB